MVLVLNGVLQTRCPKDMDELHDSHPIYEESASQLLSMQNRIVGPSNLLYVMQREFAATAPRDKNVDVIGSEDATTCIVVIVRHSGSGAVALGHFDGADTEQTFSTMIQRVRELASGYPDGRLELQLIGGYSDPNHYSNTLFRDLMSVCHKNPNEIDLTLACVGRVNSTYRNGINRPILYGVGLNVKTGEIFPASFPEKGPEKSLRISRQLSNDSNVCEIYDFNLGLLKIGPFNYKPMRSVDLWLEQSDEFILRHLSTSPDVEPPHVVNDIREAFRYIQKNPFPAVTIFRDNRPRYFRRDNQGMWVPAF